ncbi:MAG: aldo/keto reductase [Clostridia bacterium]|nr:aldo/keto reductase [Clostridia bacterium]
MEYRELGKSQIRVSKLCFGTLTISPLQKDFDINKGASILKSAFDLGVTFFDTAELYGTYPHIREAFAGNTDVVISTKSYAYDKKTAQKSLDKARKDMDRDVIDIFMLHEQESELTLRGHSEATEYFLKMKQQGVIRAFGVSTHHIACVDAATEHDEIEVIHPIFNKRGLGIADGGIEQMSNAIRRAHSAGKGIFAMKPLGGGHMCKTPAQAFDFVLDSEFVDSVAVGMQSEAEVADNCAYFGGNRDVDFAANDIERNVIVHDWCTACAKCVQLCGSEALKLINGKIEIDQSKCVFCGYCAAVCKDFAIKVI